MLRKLRRRLQEQSLKKTRLLAAALGATAVINLGFVTTVSAVGFDFSSIYAQTFTSVSSGISKTAVVTITGYDSADIGLISFSDADDFTYSITVSDGARVFGTTTKSTATFDFNLNSGAIWLVTGNSTLTTLTLNNGVVRFAAPSDPAAAASYYTLAMNALSGAGTIYLNANLANGLANSLNVTGSASGSHVVYITNTGGTPLNRYQAYKILDLSGASTVNASFSFNSIDAGAYRYSAARGSALSGYTLSGAASDYYLYNTLAPSTPARAVLGLSTSATVASYGEMNEIKKRLGDLRMGAQPSGDFWVRTYADKFNVRPGEATAYSQLMRGIEVGKDSSQSFAGGKKYSGFVLGFGRADNTFADGGDGSTNSVYVGGYGSWLKNDGSYFDLVGKYNWFNHNFTAPLLGGGSDSGSYKNSGFSLSAEIGKRFERGNGVYVQPEAELSALWVDSASYATANGLSVKTPASDSLRLRLGVTVGRQRKGTDGVTRHVYAKAGWVNEFKGESTVRVDSAAFDTSLKGHQWVCGLGYIEGNDRHQLYIDVEKSWGNTTSKEWGANVGYRWKF